VPDGTQVAFTFSFGSETTSIRQVEYTNDGIAKTAFSVINSGALDIHAESENALSNSLRFDIPASTINGAITPLPEEPTPTLEPTPTEGVAIIATQTPDPEPSEDGPGFTDWLIAMLISIGIAWSAYQLSAFVGQIRWGVRTAFIAFCGGALAYSYIALRFPGSEILLSQSIATAVFLSTFGGAVLGVLIALVWKNLLERVRRIKEAEIIKT
jgi:hypothetical protein